MIKWEKKGVVRDINTHIEVLESFRKNAENSGFYVENLTYSPIKGPEGNIEYLGHLLSEPCKLEINIVDLVEKSHREL